MSQGKPEGVSEEKPDIEVTSEDDAEQGHKPGTVSKPSGFEFGPILKITPFIDHAGDVKMFAGFERVHFIVS